MRTPIRVPDLGDGDSSRLTAWLIDEGDDVLIGDRIVELLIPGITFDVAAEVAGRFVAKAKSIDAIVEVGDTLGWIDDNDE